MDIVILGYGNIATSLAPNLTKAGHNIIQIYNRSGQPTGTVAAIEVVSDLGMLRQDADMYIYALPDRVIKEVSMSVVSQPKAIHTICAGALSMDVLLPHERRAVLYPFQTFSRQRVVDMSQVPILVEASDNEALNTVMLLAEHMSRKVIKADAESRLRLHLAGVIANNFTNHLYAWAKEELDKANLPFDILLPLIDETAQKVHALSPRAAQTGPAKRGDIDTILRHETILSDEKVRMYRLFTEDIMTSDKIS